MTANQRIITTEAELDNLPIGTVVLSASGTIACKATATLGVVFGDQRTFDWGQTLSLPVRVLFSPETAQPINEPVTATTDLTPTQILHLLEHENTIQNVLEDLEVEFLNKDVSFSAALQRAHKFGKAIGWREGAAAALLAEGYESIEHADVLSKNPHFK